jgi:hypothetical protein
MNHTIAVLNELLVGLPIGTNLAMMHVFWALLSGQLLPSRGALFPALKAIGLEDEAVRRAWTAVSKGVWRVVVLIKLWRKHVEGLPDWKQHEYEGYKGRAWIRLGSRKNPKPEKCLKTAQNPTSRLHALLGAFWLKRNLVPRRITFILNNGF